jgi:hypothetical protein
VAGLSEAGLLRCFCRARSSGEVGLIALLSLIGGAFPTCSTLINFTNFARVFSCFKGCMKFCLQICMMLGDYRTMDYRQWTIVYSPLSMVSSPPIIAIFERLSEGIFGRSEFLSQRRRERGGKEVGRES